MVSQLKYNFGNAITHFRKTGGPSGFLIKFTLAFVGVQLVLQGLGVFFNLPMYAVYVEMFAGSMPAEDVQEKLVEASNRSNMSALLVTPLSILAWMVFEGASQRRYMRGEGFRMRLGNDEWRLLVVGLLWLAIIFAAYIVFALFVGAPLLIGFLMKSDSVMAIMVILSGVFALVALVGLLYIVTRLSPAAALTVRDKSIRFFEAWTLTRGRVGPLMGANVVLWIVSILSLLIFYAVIIGLAIWRLAPAFEGQGDIGEMASQPGFWGPALALSVVWIVGMAVLQHVMAGPAALAAKDDPNWIGNENIATEFS